MKDKEQGLPVTRRDCLVAGGAAMLAAAQPATAGLLSREELRAPAGHRRNAPAFRRVHLEK